MDKIEEIDEVKEKHEILKIKMEQSLETIKSPSGDTTNDLQLENNLLKAEIIKLKTKVTTLCEENTKLSKTIQDLDSSRNEKLLDDSAGSICKELLQGDDHEALTLADKVATMEEKINRLTRLNKNLSNLKLTSCNQCTHLKNLNKSRSALKLEAKTLNQKIDDHQRKFDRKYEDAEILKNKINQELNTSSHELFQKASFVDNMDVSFVEERVRTLNNDLQMLTTLYEDKFNELEQLHNELAIDEESTFTPKKHIEKNSCRLDQIQSHMIKLKVDINELRKNNTNVTVMLNQFTGEKASLLKENNGLRTNNEELKQKLYMKENIATKKIQVLKSDLANMSEELEQFSARAKMLESQRLTLELELEELKVEWDNKTTLIESLKNDLPITNTMDNKYMEELELLSKQREESDQQALSKIAVENSCEEFQENGVHAEQLYHRSKQEKHLEARYKSEFDSMSMQYQHHGEESTNNLRMLNDTLNRYVDENLKLKQELNELKSIEEKLNEELSDIRLCMMNELRSLKCSINSVEISKQSVNEIFLILLQTLVSKEQEMIKSMRETYEGEKRILEDEIQQSADTEKRATTWARELESEIEKLQTELTEREHSQKKYENKISQLDCLLRECSRENEVLRENTKTLEIDLHNLQAEYEKTDSKQEDAIIVAQKREKELQEIFKKNELEFQSKLKAESEIYEKKINELTRALDCYKTKNLEMNSVVEGLEVNEKQLKNIIEANTAQIKKSNQNVKIIRAELEQLTEAYNEVCQQLDQKTAHMEDISAILKSKCDSLSEYRTKLEAILPEYEMLKDHVGDQKVIIERCRQEIKELKTEKEEQLETIKDKLKEEEIKNAGLSKQLNNRNVAMIEELNELREKYEEFQQKNARLERKVRCSTSKIRAEAAIEELKEKNKRLESNLEGASNRVMELQEIRNQTLTQLIDTKAMYDLLLQENTEIKKTLSSYEIKYDVLNMSSHESKLDEVLLEKNTIALELEYKKLQLTQQEKKINEYASQVQQLQEKNKELNEALEDYAVIIKERSVEISEFESKLHSRFTENTRIGELEEKVDSLNEENEKLHDQVETLRMRLQMYREKTSSDDDVKTRQNKNVIRILKRENLDLQNKLISSKRCTETKLNSSDANISIRDTSIMDQSRDSSKKEPSNLEGAWNRVTELQGEKYEIMKALADSRRQCDNLSKENFEVMKALQLYKSKLDESHLEVRVKLEKLDDSLHDENKITYELEGRTSELNQKEKNLKEYANKIRDLASKNKDLDIELGKCASTIHERDIEISKLKETLKIMKEENNKLKSEIGELQKRSRSNKSINNGIGEFDYQLWNDTITSDEHVKKQLRHNVTEENDKSQVLEKKIQDLELQLMSKNEKLAALEIQIQSENFPYRRKCKELEEQLFAFRNKNAELSLGIQKLQKTINDVNPWECDVCRRWRENRKDQGC
nr:spindle pole body component 110-like [Megalopta genalis]